MSDLFEGPGLPVAATPAARKHPTNGRCAICGSQLPGPLWVHIEGFGEIAETRCAPCMASLRADDEKRKLAYWIDNTPPEFLKPWDHALGNNLLLARVLSFNSRSRRGMVISGESGRCKTRSCYQLMRQLTLDGVSWKVVRTSSFIDSKIPEGSFAVAVLVLDDLGNELTGAGVDRQLLNLISARCDANRPTIITSQHTPETFVQRYPGQASLAIIRRLGEFCDNINANARGENEPKCEQTGLGI